MAVNSSCQYFTRGRGQSSLGLSLVTLARAASLRSFLFIPQPQPWPLVTAPPRISPAPTAEQKQNEKHDQYGVHFNPPKSDEAGWLVRRRVTSLLPDTILGKTRTDICSLSDTFKSYLLLSEVRKLTVTGAMQSPRGFQVTDKKTGLKLTCIKVNRYKTLRKSRIRLQ